MKQIKLLFPLVLFYCFTSKAQTGNSIVDRFFYLSNNFQEDSLRILLTDDFKLTRTYSGDILDKESYLQVYLPVLREMNQKFTMLKTISTEPAVYLVLDESDFSNYLGGGTTSWKMTITTINNKIQNLEIDTTAETEKYLEALMKKQNKFGDWIKKKHPDIELSTVHLVKGLLLELLKEYANKN